MNRHANAITGRLSLRPPQRHSLELLDRITEIAPPKKGVDLEAALAAIRGEPPLVTDFEHGRVHLIGFRHERAFGGSPFVPFVVNLFCQIKANGAA